MDAIAQLLMGIVIFIFEITLHALVFIFHLVMAIFSSRYREKLREDWDTSNWRRFSMALGVAFYSSALIIALFFWVPALLNRAPKVAESEKRPMVTVEIRQDGSEPTKTTIHLETLTDAASNIIKRKMEERKQAKEQDAP